jgi:hypothetical protein
MKSKHTDDKKTKLKVLDISDVKTKKRKSDLDDEPVKKKKKRVVDIEEEPVRKKKKRDREDEPVKKKKSTALVVGEAAISRLDAEGLETIMGASAEKIQQLLEVGNQDSAVALMQKRMIQALVDLLPHAEQNVRATKGQKGVYQINSLITSVRELLSDLQASKDRGALGAQLIEKILRPAFLDLGMVLVQEEQSLATVIRDNTTHEGYAAIRAAQKASTLRIGEAITKKYEESKAGAVAFLEA